MSAQFYTYAHYKPFGGIFYIGKGQEDCANDLAQRNVYWNRIVEKHGKPHVEILAYWDTEQEALEHEKLLIACFRDLKYTLANLTDGGEGISGLKHTDFTKQKMSSSHLGKQLSEKHRQHISVSKMGKNNPSFKGLILATSIATGMQQIFNGAKELRAFGFDHSAVYKCISNKIKSYKAHTFKRIEKE